VRERVTGDGPSPIAALIGRERSLLPAILLVASRILVNFSVNSSEFNLVNLCNGKLKDWVLEIGRFSGFSINEEVTN